MRKRIKMALCLCLVLCLASGCVPAFAANHVVPDSQVAQEINGKMTLTQEFKVNADVDPKSLIVDEMTVDGYDYTFTSITQDVQTVTDKKPVQVKVEQTSDTEDLADSIRLFDAEIPYDEDGYTGFLHIDPKSIVTVVSSTERRGGTTKKSATKTYDLATNDPTLVPQSIEEGGKTMKLTNLDWQATGYLPDSSIPTGYTATATYEYTQTSYRDVPTGYTTTATYVGEVSKVNDDVCIYNVTYTGVPVEADHTAMIAGLARGVGITALVALALLLGFLLIRALLNMFATVQAQDVETGEYVKIQRVRLSQKAPAIHLNMLKMPDSKHYLVTMREAAARRMRGKIIMIHAGQQTIQHKVESIYGKKYFINVDLE